MLNPAVQREFAIETVRRLRAAGFEALWAGGCVRDQLLGLTPKDYDVATSARPEQVRDLFGRKRTIPVGAAFGVIALNGPRDAGQVEIATFRSDGPYSDGRRPDAVEFCDAKRDAERRDFTINGLFFDPTTGETIDYVGGQADLRAGVVRAIRDPDERFAEDKLRMLRAVRFAATFGFTIDSRTLQAIQFRADEIVAVSAERIAAEMRRTLVLPRRVEALRWLVDTGLREAVFPIRAMLGRDDLGLKWDAFAPAAWNRGQSIVGELARPTFPRALAAIVQPWSDFDPSAAWRAVHAVANAWKLANDERDEAEFCARHEATLRQGDRRPWPEVQRILAKEGAESAWEVAAAVARVAGESTSGTAFCRERLDWPRERLDPAPLATGDDLVARGLKPGPSFKATLDAVRDAQLLGQVVDREEAIALALRLHGS